MSDIGAVQAEQHANWRAANARLWGSGHPQPTPALRRPVSPFEAKRQRTERLAELASAFPRPLFIAAIVEIDDEGQEVAPAPSPNMPAWKRIAREVSEKHQVEYVDLFSARRDQRMVRARHECFWRCLKETTMSYPDIGRRFGGRDHTTVIHGVRRHEERMMEAANG